MDPKTLAEQLAALSEYVPPPPPSPPKNDQGHEDIHDQLDENIDGTDKEDGKNQNQPPSTYAQQIAMLEKQLGWDKDDDEKEINDPEALNEYLKAKKNFSNEVNDYMNQISSWRRTNNNNYDHNRHADPGFQKQIGEPQQEQQEMFEAEDSEQEPEGQNDELSGEGTVGDLPTKSAATATKKPKTKKSTTSATKKTVVTSAKKPSLATSRSASSTNAVGGTRQQKQPAVDVTPKKKSLSEKQEKKSSDALILSKKNSENNNSKKNKDFLKNLRLSSSQSLNHQHHHQHFHNNNNNNKLPPRKTPITFTELTKTVLKNHNGNSTTTASFSVDNADALADALEQVTKIDFTNRGLTDLDAFDCLPSVTHAYLGDNHIKSIDGCEIWLDCQVLVLHDNEISSVPQLFALRNLRFLDLRRNKLFEGCACRDGETDKHKYLTERFVSFLPEPLESLEIEGNEYFINTFVFLALDDSDQDRQQNKELFWYSCLARCPNLSSIDVIGTKQEIDEMRIKRQQQIQETEEGQVEQEASNLFLEYNKTKKKNNGTGNDDDDDVDDDEQEDDPMLHGKNSDASTNKFKSNNNNSRNTTTMDDDFVEPMPDEATFAATLKQRMKMNNSRNGSIKTKNEGGDEESSSDSSSDEDDEDLIVKFKPEGDGLQARITDADFDEDGNNNNFHHNNMANTTHNGSNDVGAFQNANRPVSARNTMNLILNSARGNNNVRPNSARGQSNNNHENTIQSEISGKQHAQDEDDDVRLRLPITESIQSNVRSVTDDLLRQYGNVRRNAEAAENSRANHISETAINNNHISKNDMMTARQIIDDASRNADVTQDSIEELRSESRDLRRELLFAAQHQARVASLRVDDMWNEGVEEFKRELENSLASRRNSNDNDGIFSNKNSSITAQTSKFTPKNIFGDDGDENPFFKMKRELANKNEVTTERPRSSAYESALRVLANRSHTTVEGLDKYRKPLEK